MYRFICINCKRNLLDVFVLFKCRLPVEYFTSTCFEPVEMVKTPFKRIVMGTESTCHRTTKSLGTVFLLFLRIVQIQSFTMT